MIFIQVCEYITYASQILSRKWNILILDAMKDCPGTVASFSEIKDSIQTITPKALSLKLTELIQFGLVEKTSIQEYQPAKYKLTRKGVDLAHALEPIRSWSKQYK